MLGVGEIEEEIPVMYTAALTEPAGRHEPPVTELGLAMRAEDHRPLSTLSQP